MICYVTGLAENAPPVLEQAEALCTEAQQRYRATQRKQCLFDEFRYAADSGDGVTFSLNISHLQSGELGTYL